MSHPKSGRAGDADYEIIDAHNNLKSKVREIPIRSPQDDPVVRAETALNKLSRNFDGWMRDEVDKVVQTHDDWVRSGHDLGEPRAAFYRAAHDVKGQASTLGFPLASRAAASLCMLIERMDPLRPVPRQLVESHVEAIRAIVRERAKGEGDRVGKALVDALDGVTGEWLAENGLPEPAVEDFDV